VIDERVETLKNNQSSIPYQYSRRCGGDVYSTPNATPVHGPAFPCFSAQQQALSVRNHMLLGATATLPVTVAAAVQ
jgi:hypothetical protein